MLASLNTFSFTLKIFGVKFALAIQVHPENVPNPCSPGFEET